MFYSRKGPSINLLGPGKRRFPGGSPAGCPARKVYVYVVFSPLSKQFLGLFVQTVLPPSSKLNKRHAERVWANCLRKLFSIGFIGAGGFFGVGFRHRI